MTSTSETLLSRLVGVSQRGRGKWFARCPSHDDGRPSLSVQECDDGTLLVHFFAGCGAAEIVVAVGMSLADLFVQRSPDDGARRHRRRRPLLTTRDVIDVLDHERLVVMAVASDIQRGRTPTPDDLARLADVGRKMERLREIVS